MKFALSILVLVLSMNSFAAKTAEPGSYKLDPMHTRVSFLIPHFVISEVEGRFKDVQGEFVLAKDLKDWKINAVVAIDSIDTAVEKRDEHLKSVEFFDVKKYPTMKFVSKKFSGNAQKFKVTGDLTIKDVTKEVVLEGSYRGMVKDSWDKTRVALDAHGKIKRRDFNIVYNDMIEAGPAVGEEVKIMLITEGVRDEPEKK